MNNADDPRNGLSQEYWSDDEVQTPEKESDEQLLGWLQDKVRQSLGRAMIYPYRIPYSYDMIEHELLRRLSFCKRDKDAP